MYYSLKFTSSTLRKSEQNVVEDVGYYILSVDYSFFIFSQDFKSCLFDSFAADFFKGFIFLFVFLYSR